MIRAGNGLRLPNLYLIDKYFSINLLFLLLCFSEVMFMPHLFLPCGRVLSILPLQRPHYFTSSYTQKFFEKSDYCIVFRVKDCLSALLHLFVFLLIVTWKHRAVVLIPIFHAGKDVLNILSKV